MSHYANNLLGVVLNTSKYIMSAMSVHLSLEKPKLMSAIFADRINCTTRSNPKLKSDRSDMR